MKGLWPLKFFLEAFTNWIIYLYLFFNVNNEETSHFFSRFAVKDNGSLSKQHGLSFSISSS